MGPRAAALRHCCLLTAAGRASQCGCSTIAIPLKGGTWRTASMVLMARALVPASVTLEQREKRQEEHSSASARTQAPRQEVHSSALARTQAPRQEVHSSALSHEVHISTSSRTRAKSRDMQRTVLHGSSVQRDRSVSGMRLVSGLRLRRQQQATVLTAARPDLERRDSSDVLNLSECSGGGELLEGAGSRWQPQPLSPGSGASMRSDGSLFSAQV